MAGIAKPIIAFGSLGGTITMTPARASRGIEPSLNAEGLLASVPGLGELAEVRTATLSTIPGASLQPLDIVGAVRWAQEQVDAGASGVVLAQGTDTLEETSYLAELYWDRPEPLVFTGAMRGAAQLSADGPANVLAACQVAMSTAARNAGVLVVLDNVVHLATRVRKAHSTALGAFQSLDGGAIGSVREGHVRLNASARIGVPLSAPSGDPQVPALETYLGDYGSILRSLRGSPLDGVVISAFGVGHVSTGLADEIAAAAAEFPVVVASRTGSGGTLASTYGFSGSELDLQRRGAIMAGSLDGRKSRLLLWALLGSGASLQQIRSEFGERGNG
ncbi:MAG: hypothetical protein JWP30_2050 [Homoserinimonas sp.]|jgi:L-asparaginase|nr:hypothetical protein [Homoserinimonas sp.]